MRGLELRLRQQIEELKAPRESPAGEAGRPEAPAAETPRDFIHRKMRESAEEEDPPGSG